MKNKFNLKLHILTTLILTSSLLLTACGKFNFFDSVDEDVITDQLKKIKPALEQLVLNKSQSCDAVHEYVSDIFVEHLIPDYSNRFCLGCIDDTAEASDGGTSTAQPLTDKSPDAVSGTNNQEAGVNEPDIVKVDADGNLYVINANWFVIEDAFPPENIAQVSQLDLNSQAFSMHLDEENQIAVVFSRPFYTNEIYADSIEPYYYPYVSKTQITFIDVSNKNQPSVIRQWILDGDFTSSRRIDDQIHLASRFSVNVPESIRNNAAVETLQSRWYEEQLSKDDVRSQMKALVKGLMRVVDVNDLLPKIKETANDGTVNNLTACEEVYFPEVTINSPQLLSLTSFKTTDDSHSSSSIIANGYLTYASSDYFYLAQPSWGWWWRPDEEQQTVIHQFNIKNDNPIYEASGSVPGYVKDSFGFSEHNGYLRVASTLNSFDAELGQNRSSNHLSILKYDDQNALPLVGNVEDYAPGEQIYSSRFLGDRGFVVTFRRVDPLFAFDLSDPLNPSIKGELKIPGFSEYMHPIDENHLLTVGREGDNTGVTRKLQLQLFDVSDLTSPKLLHKFTPFAEKPGYSWSASEYEHKAFTYFTPAQVLAIPFSINDWQTRDYFNGIVTFDIDLENGISQRSKVDHSDFLNLDVCEDNAKQIDNNGELLCYRAYNYWYTARPTRSTIMQSGEDLYLYSLSREGIKASTLNASAETLGTVRLPQLGN